METLKHQSYTVGWVARLCRSWPSPGKATRISKGRNPNGKIQYLNFKKQTKNNTHTHTHTHTEKTQRACCSFQNTLVPMITLMGRTCKVYTMLNQHALALPLLCPSAGRPVLRVKLFYLVSPFCHVLMTVSERMNVVILLWILYIVFFKVY